MGLIFYNSNIIKWRIFLLLLIFITQCTCENGPIAGTAQGILVGKFMESRGGRTYSAFLGVPYAQPPKRFKGPEPPESWEGFRYANEFGPMCMQADFMNKNPSGVIGSEDCLHLNVYTPDVSGNYPVMFYIHGGGFMWGSGNDHGGKFYMDEDVILVSVNYRLGALGFFSTGDEVIPGNFGLKDQNMALRWVQENIKNFGGDKTRVTIFGASAGAASVSYHILSEKSKGLFHKAISQSGSALNPWAYIANPRRQAGQLAIKLRCANFDSHKMAECLIHEKNSTEIILAQAQLSKWNTDPFTPFGPTAEHQFISRADFTPKATEEPFLTESPKTLFSEGRFNHVPHIYTAMKDEGLVLHAGVVLNNEKLTKEINKDWLRVAPFTCYYDHMELYDFKAQDKLSDQIKDYYFGDKDISKDTYENLMNMYSDRLFLHGIQEAALLQAKAQKEPVYAGLFSFTDGPSFLNFFGITEFPEGAVGHGDDIKFHHPVMFFPEAAKGSKQEILSKMLVKLFVNFAEKSSPSLKLKSLTWPKVTTDEIETKSLKWLEMRDEPRILEGVFDNRMQFWDETLESYKVIFPSDIPIPTPTATKDEL